MSHDARLVEHMVSPLLAAAWVAGSSGARAEADTGLFFLRIIKVLWAAYATLADPAEALSALAVERHVLAVRRESQLKLLETDENNRRLGELYEVGLVAATVPVKGALVRVGLAEVAVQAEIQPDFALQAIVRRGGGARALIRVDGVGKAVYEGEVLETGHEVVAVGNGVVELVSPAGCQYRMNTPQLCRKKSPVYWLRSLDRGSKAPV